MQCHDAYERITFAKSNMLCCATGVGFGSSCGRIGAIVAPMILEATSAPFVVFAVLSVAAAASVCLLKETKGLNLED